ncbi:MAG: aminotransferase class I/II-fold pyridoxal phosphate-dependent enzyme [Terriglobia bacterium]
MSALREVSAGWDVLAAQRLEGVRYAIRDIAVVGERLAREGKRIIPLNIGDPLAFDFSTPPHLVEAVAKALHDGRNGYAPSAGLPEALEAIRAESERQGISNVRTVVVTYGVSEAADVCLTALVNPGDNVLAPCPDYPLYSALLAKLEAGINFYRLEETNGWEPDAEDVERRVNTRTRALLIIHPNNPTGAVYSRRTLEALAEVARRHRLLVIADEIYSKLVLDGEAAAPFATLAPDLPVATLNGISKAYLAPGWRVGWVTLSGPAGALDAYAEGLHKLLRARLSANLPMQYAIRPALEGPQDHLLETRARLRARRDATMEWAQATPGVECVPPRGAFYAFPKFQIRGGDEAFARQLLLEKQVMIVHGTGFGMPEASTYFRIVFLPGEPLLRESYQRIADFLSASL